MDESNNTHLTFEKWAIILIVIGILIIAAFFIIAWLKGVSFLGVYDPNVTGSIGDFIGGIVGSLWALAGVLFFYVALRYQKDEFQLQREELEKTRYILNTQLSTLKKEQFENSFFKIFELFLNVKDDKELIILENAILNKSGIVKLKNIDDPRLEALFKGGANDLFRRGLKQFAASINSFINLLKLLFNLIENESVVNSKFYSDIIVEHLNEQDKILLLFFIVNEKDEVLKKIILKYEVMRYIQTGKILSEYLEKHDYSNSSYELY